MCAMRKPLALRAAKNNNSDDNDSLRYHESKRQQQQQEKKSGCRRCLRDNMRRRHQVTTANITYSDDKTKGNEPQPLRHKVNVLSINQAPTPLLRYAESLKPNHPQPAYTPRSLPSYRCTHFGYHSSAEKKTTTRSTRDRDDTRSDKQKTEKHEIKKQESYSYVE